MAQNQETTRLVAVILDAYSRKVVGWELDTSAAEEASVNLSMD